jgi:5'-nucleotidase / UDP-sugar diphosphatase
MSIRLAQLSPLLAASLALVLLAGCRGQRPLPCCDDHSAAAAPPRTLTILHTNDLHTRFLPEEAGWVRSDPKPLVGGMVALKDRVDRERAEAHARGAGPLVVDAGDWLTGTPLSDIEAFGVKGGGFIAMMNHIGYDVSTLGNHEFDNGTDTIAELIGLANFRVVSANLFRHGERMAPEPWAVFERAGLRIGVVGLILDDLGSMVGKSLLEGVTTLPIHEAAQQAIDTIDPQTDLIVLLTHQGFSEDSLLATRVSGADLIIGGHSHTRIRSPRQINEVLVVQAGSYARDLGRLDLQVADDRVVAWEGRLIPLMVDEIVAPDPALSALVEEFQARIDAEYAVVIGEAGADFGRSYYSESGLGNLMADIVCQIAGSDVAALNSGGLRQDLKAGPVRRLDIKQVLPFQNYIVVFDLSGAELLTLLETNARNSATEASGILQLSGLSCTFRADVDGSVELLEHAVGGRPIDLQARYRLATVDYVYGLADKYFGFAPQPYEPAGGTLYESVAAWIAEHGRLDPAPAGRFVRRP